MPDKYDKFKKWFQESDYYFKSMDGSHLCLLPFGEFEEQEAKEKNRKIIEAEEEIRKIINKYTPTFSINNHKIKTNNVDKIIQELKEKDFLKLEK